MDYVLKNYVFKGIKNNKIKNDGFYEVTETRGIDYVVVERVSDGVKKLSDIQCCVRIMFNYGSANNIEMIAPLLVPMLKIFERVFDMYKLHFILVTWDYPGFGRGTLPLSYCEPKSFLSLAKEVYETMLTLQSPCVDELNLVIGHSLGTIAASYLSTLECPPDAVLLLTPMGKLFEGTGSIARHFITEPFDNEKMLQDRKCPVVAAFAEKDTVLPVQLNLPKLKNVVDHWYEEPGADHEGMLFNYDYFFHALKTVSEKYLFDKIDIKVLVQNTPEEPPVPDDVSDNTGTSLD